MRRLARLLVLVAAALGLVAATPPERGGSSGLRKWCESVLAQPGEDALRCRLLLASTYLDEDRAADASAVIEPARGKLGPLDPYADLFSGLARARLGEDGARERLDAAAGADPSGPLARAARAGEALALARTGKLDEARRALGAARAAEPALALWLGDAAAAVRPQDALPIWQAILRDHPAAPEAARAEARISRLSAGGVAVPVLSPRDRLLRAQGLVAAGLFEKALEESASLEQAPEASLLRAQALFALGRGDEAARALSPCTAAEADESVAEAALQLAARIDMRAGSLDRALADLDRAAALKTPGSDDASFLAAFFCQDAGRFQDAIARFRRYQKERTTRLDEAGFWIGFSLYKLEDFQGAAAELERLARHFPRSGVALQARYWRSRALDRAGRGGEARAALAALARENPATWYGMWARKRLGEGAPRPPAPRLLTERRDPAPLGGGREARMARARALYQAGLNDRAGDELAAAIAGERDPALLGAAARLAMESGDFGRAFRLGVDRLGGLEGAADLAYPRAFPEVVARASKSFGVGDALVWAIMRRESNFRPQVRSQAAAVGLMQLLPRTAGKIGALLGLPPEETSALDDPAVNVTLGSWYLAELSGRCAGSAALTAAAYNAGPDAVVSWLSDPVRKDLPLDEFVDSIPFRETRGYVKAVVADVDVYRRLAGEPPLGLEEKLPPFAPGAAF